MLLLLRGVSVVGGVVLRRAVGVVEAVDIPLRLDSRALPLPALCTDARHVLVPITSEVENHAQESPETCEQVREEPEHCREGFQPGFWRSRFGIRRDEKHGVGPKAKVLQSPAEVRLAELVPRVRVHDAEGPRSDAQTLHHGVTNGCQRGATWQRNGGRRSVRRSQLQHRIFFLPPVQPTR